MVLGLEKRVGVGLVGLVAVLVLLFEKRPVEGLLGEVVVLVVAGLLLPKSVEAGVVSAGFGLLLAVLAPKRAAGAGLVVAGAVVLPKRLVVLLLELLAGVVVLFVTGVVSDVDLAPKRLVAGAVVAFVATGGMVVVGFTVSAGFAGWVTPNKLGPLVLAVLAGGPNKLAPGCGGGVVLEVAALLTAVPKRLAAGAVVLALLLFPNIELPMPAAGFTPNKLVALPVAGGLLLVVAGVVEENILLLGSVFAG